MSCTSIKYVRINLAEFDQPGFGKQCNDAQIAKTVPLEIYNTNSQYRKGNNIITKLLKVCERVRVVYYLRVIAETK